MVAVDLAAVRETVGEERERWRGALKKEYDNLVGQGTFAVSTDNLSKSQLSALVPGRVVLSLKP
eukprot:3159444-Amphidinium_carterae.1